jgi:hypothetical protein
MKILINSSSLGRNVIHGGCWADVVEDQLGNTVNLSLPGAGIDYIFQTTIDEIYKNHYDLVIVLWPNFLRQDVRVDNVERDFPSITMTSNNMINKVSKLDKINQYLWKKTQGLSGHCCALTNNFKNADVDLLQKNWLLSRSLNNFLNPHADFTNAVKVFDRDKFVNVYQRKKESILKIVSLQSILKTQNIPYIFASYKPMTGFLRLPTYYNMIDWDNFYTSEYLFCLAAEKNLLDKTRHALPSVQEQYGNLMVNRICRVLKQGI